MSEALLIFSKQYSFGTKISLNCGFFSKKIRLNIARPMENLFLVSPSLEELCLERLGHFPARCEHILTERICFSRVNHRVMAFVSLLTEHWQTHEMDLQNRAQFLMKVNCIFCTETA